MRRATLLLVLYAAPFLAANEHWPQFRGGSAANVADGGKPPDQWSPKDNVVWQTDVPGRGWSSPVVWGDRVFVTAVLNDKTPTPRKGLYIQDLQGKTPPGEHRWVVYCLDFNTGKILWERTAHKGTPAGPIHLKNTYASETPVTDGKRVYAYFGNLGLYCFDMEGKELWSEKWPGVKTRYGWGTAASPVLHQDRVYVVNDNEEQSYLVALDKVTGKQIWRVEREEKSNWATPFVWENGLRTEIVTPGTGKVRSYDLDGKPLWEFAGMSSVSIPMPSAAEGMLFVSSGYILDSLRPVYAIKPGAKGDITLKKDETKNEFIAWCQKQAGPYHPSPLVYRGHVYVLLDKGFLACYDAKTGKEVYGKQRLSPDSDMFTASPWAYDGKIFCLSEDGETFVVRAGAKFEVIGRNSLDEMCLATPAVVRDSLLVRTASKVYRFANAPKAK